MSNSSFDARNSLLLSAVAAIAEERSEQAARLLDQLLAGLVLPADLTWHIFARALARRIDHRPATDNLYLRNLDLAQISLFNVLAEHLPLVNLSGRLGNELLAGFLARRTSVTLIDLGIGTAQQEIALLETLAERNALPQRLRLVAIEPGRTSLDEARLRLTQTAQRLGLQLEFVGFGKVAEALTGADWAAIADDDSEVVVNAAFAAHHIQSTGAGPAAARDEVFRRLRALDPVAVLLLEPHSDHINPDFSARFAACWRHFGAIFRFVDGLPIAERDRSAIKLFFAREIDDILANSEETRAERHETTEAWLARLVRTGFVPLAAQAFAIPEAAQGVQLSDCGSHIRLAVADETVVSVICATSGTARAEAAGWIDTRAGDEDAVGTRAGRLLENTVKIYSKAPKARLRVGDVMSREVATIRAGTTLREAARRVDETGASDLVVVADDGSFVGVLSEGDLIRAMMPRADQTDTDGMLEAFERLLINGRARAAERIDALVIRDPIVLSPDDDLLRVADIMVTRQIRRLPVVDGQRAVGSISRADLCRVLLDD